MGIFVGKDVYKIADDSLIQKSSGGFKLFFIIKAVCCFVIAIGIIIGLYASKGVRFCPATTAYYIMMLAFLLHTSFCVYCIFNILTWAFWKKVGIINGILWGIEEYLLLLFTWILFCNMVTVGRKKREREVVNGPWVAYKD